MEIGGGGDAGGNGEGHAVRRVPQLQGGGELRLHQAQHPYAVFQLGVFLIEFVRRDLPAGLDIQLVPAPEDAAAVPLQAAPGIGFHHVQGLGGVLFGKGGQRGEALTEFGQAHGHNGDAVHLGVQCLQLPHGLQQGLPVVQAGAADDLAVHNDAGLGKAAHDLHALPCSWVAQQLTAQLRVGGVDGDVDGADVQGDDTLDLPPGEIGQGDVIAQQEAEPGVIILEVHGGAHALGQLVNEAEDAAVGAGPGRVHQVAFKV